MIKLVSGDIFKSTMQTLIIPINKVGVMGKGLALECAKKYPHVLLTYKLHCQKRSFDKRLVNVPITKKRYVLLFPTKSHWRDKSTLELIRDGLHRIDSDDKMKALNITSLAFPRIGCGEGGLDFEVVLPIIQDMLKRVTIPIEVYVD